MISRRSTILVALVAAAPLGAQPKTPKPVWPDEGPYKWAPRPTNADITSNDLRTRLYQIADDSMLGRRIGEPGNFKTAEYVAREFKRLGLKPAGEDGTYFQSVPFGPTGFDSTTARLVAGASTFAGKTDWIPTAPTATNGIGGTVNLANVPTVFAGRWGDTVTLDPALFRGKVAVFVGAPGAAFGGRAAAPVLSCDAVPYKFGAAAAAEVEAKQRADSIAGRGNRARTGVARDVRAQNAGAVAILNVGLEGTPVATISGAFNLRGAMRPTPGGSNVGAAIISQSVASKLFDKPVAELAIGAAGQPVTAHWSYEWHMAASPARNIIAVMPGSDPTRAAEYVLVGAHNDHIGANAAAVDHDSLRAFNMVTRPQGNNDPLCKPTAEQQHRIDSLIARARSIRPARRDSINNGADDDGSGTVVLLEIAERFASEKPARSIIFISHVGEEAGLLGSKWFAEHPTIPLASVAAAHNMDMLGKGRVDQVKFGGPTSIQTLGSRRLSREFGDIIDSVNAVRTETMAIDKSWDVVANPMNRFCRSDQVNYVRQNVPITYFSLGYAEDYHQVTDEPQYIEYDHMARAARFIHDIMVAVSERKTRPAIAGADPSYPSCGGR